MAKRSPILGYNHNVRYRGLVFHVQTEDSGLLNPHLFTHLFHGGVIVSTRKLVYDAGSNEDAIKSLMQAQHKAVMKDLKRGTFDDKIDQYLGDTPGLEPRLAKASPRDPRATTESEPLAAENAAPLLEIVNEGLSEPIELPLKQHGVPTVARAITEDRTVPVDRHRAAPPPPSADLDPPTIPTGTSDAPPTPSRTKTAQRGSRTQLAGDSSRAQGQVVRKAVIVDHPEARDSAPVIEISVDDDDEVNERIRGIRDTAVEMHGEPMPEPQRTTTSRPASHGAATLPAMRPPTRPVTPPVVARQPTQERKRDDSQAVEIYSPALPPSEPPPGERPGQYSMSRKEGAPAIREKTGRINALTPSATTPPPSRRNPSSSPVGAQPAPARQQAAPAVARTVTPQGGSRTTTSQHTQPLQNRTPSPAAPQPGSGVVMTRPAVIVGAPPKPPPTPQQRVRKAREDEGRGFGQGLISEKSLDEVILAYLSEDAEDK